MDMKEQAQRNADSARQAAVVTSGCKACERKGIPIFPLRVAVMPKDTVNTGWYPVVPAQAIPLTGGGYKYGLRTLRMGYLYVLLDKSVWQGYEVTADGCMREFNAHEMPEGSDVRPLSPACHTANHDTKTSFIHIDNSRYSSVWMAFTRDAWSREVLTGYKNGQRPDSRFTKLTVSKDGTVSAEGAIEIDFALTALTSNVAEFATEFFGNSAKVGEVVSGGAHGFFPRQHPTKMSAMRNHVSLLSGLYHCKVMAVPVADPVGIIQELNIARLMLLEAASEYIEQPGIFHKHMISEAIVGYLGQIKAQIANCKREYLTECLHGSGDGRLWSGERFQRAGRRGDVYPPVCPAAGKL